MENLKKAVAELNKPIMVDGEEFDRGFNFVIREDYEREGDLVVFDANENYNYDYNDNNYWLMVEAAEEFGLEKPTKYPEDTIHEKLEEAVKKDFGKSAYLEWYDSVVMMVAR